MYQHTKNEAASSICSGEILHLKILQSEWLTAFWPIFQEQNFSQIGDLYRNAINFHYKQIQGKSMTRFFFKFKTLYFWPTSTNFGGKKCFPKKPGIHNLIQFLVPCRNSEKPNDPIPRKQHNTQQDGKMDRPSFMESFRLLLGV